MKMYRCNQCHKSFGAAEVFPTSEAHEDSVCPRCGKNDVYVLEEKFAVAELERLTSEQVHEDAVRFVAYLLVRYGAVSNQTAEQSYMHLRNIVEAILEEIERQGNGFDEVHPKGYMIMLAKLRDTIDKWLHNDDWTK